jgi:predicted RNase H-like HicB family nuclease/DNA-binding XRE family transcriptional regulator
MAKINRIYPAVIKKDGKYYMVEFPDLPGCFSQGKTVEEAFVYAKEALSLYLDGLKSAPKPSDIFSVEPPQDGCVSLVEADESDGITRLLNDEVSRIINAQLEKTGFTKYKVAKILGVSESYINRISTGARTPSPDIAKRMATLLNFDWQVFYA